MFLETIEHARGFVPPRVWGLGYHVLSLRERLIGRLAEIDKNVALRDSARGRRGFLIGNGASLRALDLTKLRDEAVVTVNSFTPQAVAAGIRPIAHVFYDRWYFEQGQDQLRAYAAGQRAEHTFFPLQSKPVVESLVPEARYFYPAGALEDNRNLDLARAVPNFQTVALPALLIALHLGLDPIYLIGCDMDFLSHVVGVAPLRVRVPYVDDGGAPQVVEPEYDYEGYTRAIARMFTGYRFVRDHLPAGRSVLNAGAGGLLDLFPRVTYDELFRK
jgi:hypothetical protein